MLFLVTFHADTRLIFVPAHQALQVAEGLVTLQIIGIYKPNTTHFTVAGALLVQLLVVH